MLEALGVPLAGDAPEGIVVGFSGGADSAALLHFLTSDMLLGARITALHINHMLRGDEAERERLIAKFTAYCRRNRVRASWRNAAEWHERGYVAGTGA